MAVQRISKPAIVDFLRLCDRKRWCSPRIRYASIRSKSELVEDLLEFFRFTLDDKLIRIQPLKPIHDFPRLEYCLRRRTFLMESIPYNFAKESRRRPQYRFERRQVTIRFEIPRSNDTTFVEAATFPLRDKST